MEFELGLKIIKNKDKTNRTLTALHIAKDRSGPLFFSRETEKAFVLTAHLKGFRRERIRINISKDQTQISIAGEKPVQEMAMKRLIMYKREVEFRGFRKVFRIPDGVNIDKITAKFNAKETILSILMPKTIHGIQGIGIEEVAEAEGPIALGTPPVLVEEAPDTLKPELKQSVVTEVRDAGDKEVSQTVAPASPVEKVVQNEQTLALPEEIQEEKPTHEQGEEPKKPQLDKKLEDPTTETLQNVQTEIQEERDETDQIQTPGEDEGEATQEQVPKPRNYRLCSPCIFVGSAFIGFIIVLVVQFIRTHKKSKKN